MNYKTDKRREVYSRWASVEEICASLHKVELNDYASQYGGIPLYTDETSAWIEARDVHSLIIGATGSKKTRLIGMPSIRMYAYAGESIIATDPKGELYEHSYHLLKKLGYSIRVFNLRAPLRSNTWNPLWIPFSLYRAGFRDQAIEMVLDLSASIMGRVFSSDPYWGNSAGTMLAGLLLVLFECADGREIHFKSLQKLRAEAFESVESLKFSDSTTIIRERFMAHINKSSFAASLLSGTVDVTERTQSCIVSTFDQQMNTFFCQDNLVNMLSGNQIDFGDIGKKRTAVFLIMPDENTLYHSLISVFVKQCYSQLIRDAQKMKNKTLPVRVNFLLDEFSALPCINDFSAMITAARSRNIRFNLIIQSIYQLKVRYGDEAETIKGNCGNWVFLHSRELTILNELKDLAGMTSYENPLISAAQLQRLDKHKGEAFILHERQYPFISTLKDINEYPDVAQNEEKVPYPRNTTKVEYVFDFIKFCECHSPMYLSLLFGDNKPETDIWSKDNNGEAPNDHPLDGDNNLRGEEKKMDMPENYVREAGSFIIDNSLFRQRDIMRCLCGYTGDRHDEWLHFRAVAVHNENYRPEQLTNKKLEPPVNGVRIYVCPRCGTAKVSVYAVEGGFMINRHPLDLGFEKVKQRKQPTKKAGEKK